MTLDISLFNIGPMGNNSYLISDQITKKGIVIDPSFGSTAIKNSATHMGIDISEIWITHAHFDHIAGIPELANLEAKKVRIGIHDEELDFYHSGGGSSDFGLEIDMLPEPDFFFLENQIIPIGNDEIKVIHTPGHRPGHVIFYYEKENSAFCGDVIFKDGIGRTDLPGGSYKTLMTSIETRILSLPKNTRLFPGHGPSTTVGDEFDNYIEDF